MKTIIIFFDMEGTIFKKAVPAKLTRVPPSAWYVIAERLGPRALREEKRTQAKWINKKYRNYLEWMEDTISIHKKYKLKKELFCDILDSIEFAPGVRETFDALNRAKIITSLISGGFKYQADRAIQELKIKHSFIACEYFWNSDEFLEHWNLLPADERGKVSFMKLLINEYKINGKSCAFIGDGDNDIPLAQEVGISICFNGSKRLSKYADYSIKQPPEKVDFRAILDYIDI
jgi:phosphoserine phosphatase